jgi:predicted dehydrogenase
VSEASALARPRLGFVGLGWIGRHRLEALVQSGKVEIAALCEPDAAALELASALAPGATCVPSFGRLLEQPLDGVVIATPSAQHAQQAIAALERGVAVFCQKPLGRNADEVRKVVAAARARDRLLGVDFSYRGSAAVQQLRDMVRDGAVGDVFAAQLVFHNAYGPDKAWFYDPAASGGGALMDLGVHLVDLLLWTLDFPSVTAVTSQLFAQGKPLRDASSVEDYAAAQLTLESGTVVQLVCSWRLHAGRDCAIEASLFGTRGGVAFHNRDGSFYDFSAHAYTGTQSRTLAEPPDAWGGRMAVEWASRLARGERFDDGAHRFIQVAQVIDRIYAAAQCQRPVGDSCAF